jgi:hypothetical protein
MLLIIVEQLDPLQPPHILLHLIQQLLQLLTLLLVLASQCSRFGERVSQVSCVSQQVLVLPGKLLKSESCGVLAATAEGALGVLDL